MIESADIAERLLSRVIFEDEAFPENGCWFWTGALTDRGYASFSSGYKSYNAHRWLYQWKYGPLPATLQLDHLCRNRHCINPDHLEPLTQKEHSARTPENSSWFTSPTHCKYGHELTPENVYLYPNANGRFARHCRTCRRLRQRKDWAK
jgi:HNH endonuclease